MKFYSFDFHGAYLGYIDNGTFFDSQAREWGRVSGGGEVSDLAGRYRGRIDAQGCYFDQDGGCRGYVRGWVCLPPAATTAGRAPGPQRGSGAQQGGRPA